jgi:hypothetical protein
VVRWLADPFGLSTSAGPAYCLGAQRFFVLCHLELRVHLCLLAFLRESVCVIARRHIVGLVLDPLHFEVGSHLLIIQLILVLLLEVPKRVWLGSSFLRTRLHLLLGAFFQRVPLLLKLVNELFVHGFQGIRRRTDVLDHFWTAIGDAIAQRAQTALDVGLYLDRDLNFVFIDVAVIKTEAKFEQTIVRASIFLHWINRVRELEPTLVASGKQPRTCKSIVHA